MINKPGKCGKDTEIRVLFVCPGKSGIRTPKFSFRLFRYFCRGKAETDAFGSIQINPNVLSVKSGTARLESLAHENGCAIALYGHTHVPVQTYEDGLYLCNPGSLHNGDYAVLEIVRGGVMWLPKRIY